MEQIIFTLEFDSYLEELIYKLFEKEYFGFIESSSNYVAKIYDFIELKINTLHHKLTPTPLNRKGGYYVHYNPNPGTTWYVLFEKIDTRILITSIFNNYSKESAYFNL